MRRHRPLARQLTETLLATALLALPVLKPSLPARSDQYDDARVQHPALFRVYYDQGLLEYCGLLTADAAHGFTLRRDDLLTAAPMTEDQHRNVRIAAMIAIDYEYQDHGLSGQRLWCRTEGRDAYNRFVARSRGGMSNSEAP